jgi:hypothetical protein
MAYEVKVSMTITKEGNPFASTVQEYANMSYEDVLQIEKAGVGFLAELTKWGEKHAKS